MEKRKRGKPVNSFPFDFDRLQMPPARLELTAPGWEVLCCTKKVAKRSSPLLAFLQRISNFFEPFGRSCGLALPLTSSADTPSLLRTRCPMPRLCRSRCACARPVANSNTSPSCGLHFRFPCAAASNPPPACHTPAEWPARSLRRAVQIPAGTRVWRLPLWPSRQAFPDSLDRSFVAQTRHLITTLIKVGDLFLNLALHISPIFLHTAKPRYDRFCIEPLGASNPFTRVLYLNNIAAGAHESRFGRN